MTDDILGKPRESTKQELQSALKLLGESSRVAIDERSALIDKACTLLGGLSDRVQIDNAERTQRRVDLGNAEDCDRCGVDVDPAHGWLCWHEDVNQDVDWLVVACGFECRQRLAASRDSLVGYRDCDVTSFSDTLNALSRLSSLAACYRFTADQLSRIVAVASYVFIHIESKRRKR